MTDVVLNFAAPLNDEALIKQANVLADAFLVSFGKVLARLQETRSDSHPLCKYISAAARAARPGARAWSPEIGVARGYLRAGANDAAVAQTALLVSRLSKAGNWSAHLKSPKIFLVGGIPISLVGDIVVECSDDRLAIHQSAIGRNHATEFACDDLGVWRLIAISDDGGLETAYAPMTLANGPAADEKFVLALAANPNVEDDVEVDEACLVDSIDPAGSELAEYAAGQMRQAYELVDKTLPEFSQYVRLLLRGLAAVPSVNGGRASGSSFDYPGIFTCTFPGDLDWFAETLVHEASHQYMNLLKSAFPLTQADDGKRYYSSIKRMYRDLGRQMIGYHAVVNIVLFRRALIERCGSSERRVAELGRFQSYADEMRQELAGGTTFTEEGRVFIGELNRRLDG